MTNTYNKNNIFVDTNVLIGAVARLMGCLCNDMTIIQEELYG